MSFLASVLGGNLKLGGGFGFSDQTTDTSQNTSQNQNFNTSGTATTAKTLTPYQSMLQGPIASTIMQLMLNPQSFVAPFKAAARDTTNSTYANLGDTLRQQFLGSTGGGQSGKYGMALAGGNLQRLSDLSRSDAGFDQTAATLPLSGAALAEQFLGQNFGTTASQTASGTSAGTSATTGKSSTSGFNLGV